MNFDAQFIEQRDDVVRPIGCIVPKITRQVTEMPALFLEVRTNCP